MIAGRHGHAYPAYTPAAEALLTATAATLGTYPAAAEVLVRSGAVKLTGALDIGGQDIVDTVGGGLISA